MNASITTEQHRSHLEILSCIRLDDKGSRCLGLLESQVENQLLCVKCNSSYSTIDEIPVLKENAGSTLDEFYSQVYENISRLEAMREDNPRMQQAQTLWDLLPRFVTEHNIEGYSLEIGCGPGIFADRVPN